VSAKIHHQSMLKIHTPQKFRGTAGSVSSNFMVVTIIYPSYYQTKIKMSDAFFVNWQLWEQMAFVSLVTSSEIAHDLGTTY
jgi:hypothetical protein